MVVELATVAGGLVGAGVGFMIAPDDGAGGSSGKLLATGATLGGIAGFALAYLGLDTLSPPPARETGFRVQLTPDLRPGHRGLALAGSF